jgi:nucleoside 2-deoxyribosyltransferase
MKEACARLGFEARGPLDPLDALGPASEDPLERACGLFAIWQKDLHNCDIFIGDLNDFEGLEPNNDVAFEAGAAWKQGDFESVIRQIAETRRGKNGHE